MSPLVRLVRSAGNAGAVANAQRACEEHKLAEARLAARLEEIAARTSPRGARRSRTAA